MESFSTARPVVAVIGGGQLARMMQESAIALGLELRPLVEELDGSTGQVVVASRVGTPADADEVRALVDGASVLTFEHEHIPTALLAALEGELPIEPKAEALLYAQDKLAMRERLSELGIPCPKWAKVEDEEALDAFGEQIGFPLVVKTPRGGYDGHGVRVVDSASEVADWFASGPLLAEELVPYSFEVSALCARRPSGEIASWPLARSEQVDGVCSVVTAPAPGISPSTAERATKIGERIAAELGVTGVLAVEMFVVKSAEGERLFVNELAMRPHNTGHWTIDGAVTSQFEQHLRAVLDLPLGSTAIKAQGSTSVMVNLLGSTYADPALALPRALAGHPEAKIHLYGKEVRPRRKLGHVTVVDEDPLRARSEAETVVALLRGDR
ncbi:5-(carboxyamino)imidazole ribonucleotide synthase [Schaalia hyovaginalis]|uniref:5-(carboxyamino)imidazole ribonucleotide synthase n=1 Tax=Schaalia hyovaginalis TaxID=29316 RepID=UPI0026EC15F4|nr:5-(carboxyamino)imidazole ribonucleotide synthase [Schaalia hyovaginalis]MCI6557627.1 5-(carboxyamino)imidazole ribonucleotide synthase [Schaalia hyovaginalis]MDD7553302.1 5-(carboxyamino)imidazole ribonucleotide synthase [Schaalia hyovaginalis]MDY3093026.1 5-(carboxyamino)imidazole ribonucleotide synthase [Schaalia hyovaginalis]